MRRTLQLQCGRRQDKPLIAKGRGLTVGSSELLSRELDLLESKQSAADFNTYSVLLRQCCASKSLEEGKRVHAHMSRCSCKETQLENLLVQMYGACGDLAEAKRAFDAMDLKNAYSWNIMVVAYAQNGHLHQAKAVFDDMPVKGVISWTSLIAAYAQNGQGLGAIQLFCLMDLEGVQADKITFVSAIDACSCLRSMELGRSLHTEAVETRHELHYAVATALISMYGKCRRIDHAKEIFDRMPERNIVSWTAMITAYAQNGHLHSAVGVYNLMPERNVVCSTALVAAYAQNGHLQEAENLFTSMATRNAISWGTMIQAYNQNGDPSKALELFNTMESDGIRSDKCTFVSVLEVCSSLGDVSQGRRVHQKIAKAGLESSTTVANALINMYARCGSCQDAKSVFDRLPQRTISTWNSMMNAFTQSGRLLEAKEMLQKMPETDLASWNTVLLAVAQEGHLEETRGLFSNMPYHDAASRNALILSLVVNECDEDALQELRYMDLDGIQPNRVTYLSVLEACSNLSNIEFGKVVRSCVTDSQYASDTHVGTSLVTMFTKCEFFHEASEAFEEISVKNVLSWTAMLLSYAQSGDVQYARWMFDAMPARDLAAWNAMVTGYAQFGHSTEAKELFDKMPERNVISWTAVISAYAQSGHPKEAYLLFRTMDLYGQRPNKVTFLKALEACAGGVTEGEAKTIHAKAVEAGQGLDPQVQIGLLNMYDKCGKVEYAKRIFDGIVDKTVVAWSILISAYSQAGEPRRSVEMFREMVLVGVMPTEITFVNLLSACSHGGFLRDSWEFFVSMIGDYGLDAFMDHYVCVVDVLGRCGQLKLAQDLLENMPYEPNTVAWTSLLSACKIQGDSSRGACVGGQVIDLNPDRSGPYRMVSNMCVA